MTWRPPRLLEPAELESFAARARVEVHTGSVNDDASRAAFARSHALVVRGLEGLRLAARLYALEDDESALMPIVWGGWAIERRVFELDLRRSIPARIADAVRACGPRLLEIPGLAERLAGSASAAVRRALADAVPAEAGGVLRALATDTDPTVRDAACRRLGVDPNDHAFPAPTEGHAAPVLRAARAVLVAAPYDAVKAPGRAVRAFAPLEDALAVACWERALALDVLHGSAIGAWSRALVARRGGGDAFARVARTWLGAERQGVLAAAVKALVRAPEATRHAVSSALLAALDPSGEPRDDADRPLADAIAALGARPKDARRILERVLGCPLARADGTKAVEGYGGLGVRSALSEALEALVRAGRIARDLRRALVRARRAGTPGRWAGVGAGVYAALGPDPVLRQRAWRTIDRRDGEPADAAAIPAAVRAAFEHRDPARDGSRRALGARLFARPELRAVLLDVEPTVVARATKALLAGDLDVRATVALLGRLRPPGRREETVPEDVRDAARAVRDRALETDLAPVVLDDAATWIPRGFDWSAADLAFARTAALRALAPKARPSWLDEIVIGIVHVHADESDTLLDEMRARATDAQRARIDEAVAWARDL